MQRIILGLVFACAAACGGGQYGYARYYEPLDEEEALLADSVEPAYTDLQRDPAAYREQRIGWFGIVREVEPQADGTLLVRMSQRAHAERHLCEERSESSCRVTVSEHEGGPFSVRVRLTAGADSEGVNRVQRESLLKIYGRVSGDYDITGGPFLTVDFYRHWPRGQYVDTTAQSYMRR